MPNSSREQSCLSPWFLTRLGRMAGVHQFITVHAGKSKQPIVDGLEQDVSHGGSGLGIRSARHRETKLGEGVVKLDAGSARWLLLAEPFGKHRVFDAGKHPVGSGDHKKSLQGSLRTHIWRTGDLLLPLRATSSYHRCRSKAGWRGRRALSGCRPRDSSFEGHVKFHIVRRPWMGR
jgi:hypothetical protein